MPLQSSLSPLKRSPKPFLLLRTCLVLLQHLPAHLCKCFIQIIKDMHTVILLLLLSLLSQEAACCWQHQIWISLCVLNNFVCDCTERAFEPARSVTVWSGACMDSGNWDTLGHFLSGRPSSHQLPHCHSPGMMTCLPLDFPTPPVWRHSLTTQVELKTLYYYISLVYNK